MRTQLPKELIELDPYLRPSIRMSPFSGKLPDLSLTGDWDSKEAFQRISSVLGIEMVKGLLTCNGREALEIALASVVKSPQDKVAIITASNCGYVSSCVTRTIEKFCTWLVGEDHSADIVLLIHEFGRHVVLPEIYKKKKTCIIEDCAYAWVDQRFSNLYGKQGHYLVYSFPKAFPVQYGGMLVSTSPDWGFLAPSRLTRDGKNFFLRLIKKHIENTIFYNEERVNVYEKMKNFCKSFSFLEQGSKKKDELPHAFLVAIDVEKNGEKVKTHMNTNGVESSNFYGGGAYFLPCHQELNDADIEYMFEHLGKIL